MTPNNRPAKLLPGRQITSNERPSSALRKRDDLTFLVGVVSNVDVDKQAMTVQLFESAGILQDVPITQPFAGTSSFIAGTPEIGSIVILGSQGSTQWVLTYLPHYAFGLDSRVLKKWPDEVSSNSKNIFYYRIKKLNPGEVALGSSGGAELFLGDYLKLDDRVGNSFLLKTDENSLISTACNNYVFSSGIWMNQGIIYRNSIDFFDDDENPNVFRHELPRGKNLYTLRPGSANTDPYYTEYLLEVEEKAFGQQPSNDVNSSSDSTIRKPIAVFSLGNLVGNKIHSDTYGKMLGVRLFNSPDDSVGELQFLPLVGDSVEQYGMAISLFKPDRANSDIGAYFGVDKEGHFYQYIPATSAGGMGKGRSMSILARGSKKEIWGNDTRFANSWDLKTTGGILWDIGSHNEADGSDYKNRSIDIRTSSSVFYMYGSRLSPDLKDFDDTNKNVSNVRSYFKVEKIGGKERHETTGDRETILGGSDKLSIKGAKVEQINGYKTISVGSNMNIIVGDALTEKVSKEKQETFGNRKTSITNGGSVLSVRSIQGDIKEEIMGQGSKSVKIKLGNIQETILTGSRNVKITTGNFSNQTSAGNISQKTKAGQVLLQTKVGKMEMKASLNIDMKTTPAANVNFNGGTVNFKGRTGVMGGIVTSKTHQDYTTGAPLRSSVSVKGSF